MNCFFNQICSTRKTLSELTAARENDQGRIAEISDELKEKKESAQKLEENIK